jgi:tetraacyldisaccharide 4'-kinase
MVAELGGRPLIVSRGYGRPSGSAPGDRNDEARELDGLAPSVPHVQNPDRSAAIHDWTTTHACDIVILDDGFQHRRLARDVDIVLIDALHPFGHGIGDFGRVLPRGILREPLSALRRAHIIIITRSEFLGPSELGTLKQTLSRVLRLGVPVLCASHLPTGVLLADGSRRPTEWLRRQDVAAACGIGNPEAFRWTLGQVGARLRLWEAFPDHHAYNRADIERLLRETAEAGLKTLVTTGKDFVKWRPLIEAESAPAAVTVASVEVALVITEGEEVLRRRLADLLKRGRT